MRTNLLSTLFYLIVVEMALPSFAAYAQSSGLPASQYGNGVVNSAGQWAQQVGTVGARANRDAADQLFKNSLQHEAQGWSSFPPNIGLLSQALTESQQGIKADDQARHFAQTSLQALKTGNTAGNVDLAGKYGSTEDDLRDLANHSSPYLPAVQAKLDGYGIKVDHDKDLIKTPFGQFPMNISPEDLAKEAGKIASSLGFSAASIGEGVSKAIAGAQEIGQRALAKAQAEANQGRSVASTGADGSSGTASEAKSGGAAGDKATGIAKAGIEAANKNPGAGTTAEQDLQARTLALSKSREEMALTMGNQSELLGDKRQNLFAIVHERYQELRHQGSFNEYGQRLAVYPSQ